MSVEKEKQYVIEAFPGPKWAARVEEMADDQIVAIYLRLKQNENEPKKPKDPPNPQGTLF